VHSGLVNVQPHPGREGERRVVERGSSDFGACRLSPVVYWPRLARRAGGMCGGRSPSPLRASPGFAPGSRLGSLRVASRDLTAAHARRGPTLARATIANKREPARSCWPRR